MEENNKAEFQIEVSATNEELDRITRQLLSELRELDVESVELAKNDSVLSGTKSVDPVMLDNIAIALVPAFLQFVPIHPSK